jgi:hypothetical protein
MSALRKHVEDQQTRSCQLIGVLEAIATLDNEGIAPNAVTTLIQVALNIANEIDTGLDCVNLPKD